MLRWIFTAIAVALLPSMAGAQTGCPADANTHLHDLTAKARAAEVALAELGTAATGFVTECGEDRVVLSQLLAMFTAAGLGIEPPSPERFQAHLFAYRTMNRIGRTDIAEFEPVRFAGADGTALEWGPLDERNAYWDLMFAMSSDFLVYGVHADIYTAGKTETIGCGLYPAEEASALARQAEGNLDGGELLARIAFLGRGCDDEAHEVSGYAAQYFAEHARARAADPDYMGLTESDIHAGLTSFLDRHLDGEAQSWLFDAGAVAELRAF